MFRNWIKSCGDSSTFFNYNVNAIQIIIFKINLSVILNCALFTISLPVLIFKMKPSKKEIKPSNYDLFSSYLLVILVERN